MKISRDEITVAIRTLWPDCHIWIPRIEYWAPTRSQLRNFIRGRWQEFLTFVEYDINLFACSNFAFLFTSLIDLYVVELVKRGEISREEMREWSVLAVWGSRFQGQDFGHAVTLTIVEDGMGLYLFEPQQAQPFWKPDIKQDVIHFAVL